MIRILYLLALIVWLGEVLCVSFVVAPTLFRTFAVADAGRAVGAIFPIYYQVGYVSGAALLIAALILRSMTGGRAWTIVAALTTVMLVATLYAGLSVQPRAQALRLQLHEAGAPASVNEEFDHLHRLAVQLNSVVLLGGLAAAVVTALNLKS